MPGVYIHVPFCERKCVYCDFYSIEDHSSFDAFVDAVVAEIGSFAEEARGTRFGTIFFGGGTPSLLAPNQLAKILDELRKGYSIENDAEVTLEANPGTISAESLSAYRSLGINRLSIGVQSFHNDELKFLGRIHNADEARRSVSDARRAGFSNISIDLILALPGQTIDKLEISLAEAVALDPKHISAYTLIVEKGTPLYRLVQSRQVAPLPSEAEAELYAFSMDYLIDRGFEHYEVSNYARPGFRSRHNSGYWDHSPYLGFGPSAHSFWKGKRMGHGHRVGGRRELAAVPERDARLGRQHEGQQ